jgi:DNA-binding response OmpR family regulator
MGRTKGESVSDTTVLVVEDDKRVAGVIGDQLREEGYTVVDAQSIAEAEVALGTRSPDVVVLDVMLPDGSGFDLCRTIRRGDGSWNRGLGIVVLSARVEEADVLRGFARGADDYLRKPFSMPELVARVRAIAQRKRRPVFDVLFVGDLRIDLAARTASFRGTSIALAAKEFEMLATLAIEPGAVYSKKDLLTRIWGVEPSVRTRTVESHVSRLRRKLAAAGMPGAIIVNAWGLGYRLEVTSA